MAKGAPNPATIRCPSQSWRCAVVHWVPLTHESPVAEEEELGERVEGDVGTGTLGVVVGATELGASGGETTTGNEGGGHTGPDGGGVHL